MLFQPISSKYYNIYKILVGYNEIKKTLSVLHTNYIKLYFKTKRFFEKSHCKSQQRYFCMYTLCNINVISVTTISN